MKNRLLTHVILLSLLALGASHAEDAILDYPLRPADLSSPAATIKSLCDWSDQIFAMSSGPVDRDTHERLRIAEGRLMDCLDLSDQPEYSRDYMGREAALSIKEILDRLDLSKMEIPRRQADSNGVPLTAALPVAWTLPDTELVLLREEREGRDPVFRFSKESVANAFSYYEQIDHLPLKSMGSPDILRRCLYEPRSPTLARLVGLAPSVLLYPVWRHALWQWLALLVSAVVGLGLIIVFVRLRRHYRWRLKLEGKFKSSQGLLGPLGVMLGAFWLRGFVSEDLGFRGAVAEMAGFCTGLLALGAMATVVVVLGGKLAAIITATSSRLGRKMDDQIVQLTCRIGSFGVAALIFVEGGKAMGIPLSTLLAGAGIGGLAVALSAQDALKNVIGGVLLSLDKPLAVGDLVNVGGYTGIVQTIGLRSTRLEDFSGHQISIPNDQVATSSIENIGRRGSIRRLTDLALPLDISREKAELAATLVREILKDHDGLDPEQPPHVFLCDLERDRLVLRLLCYYTPPDYMAYLAFCERTNLAIMAAFEAHHIRFALPATETLVTGRAEAPIRVVSNET